MANQPTDVELLMQAWADVEATNAQNPEVVLSPDGKDNQYKFMRELLKTPDSKKIGNLTNEELGMTRLSLRGSLKIASLAQTFNRPTLAKYYREKAEIIAATSMSRKGNFLQLIFTKINKSFAGLANQQPRNKGLFNWGKKGGDEGG